MNAPRVRLARTLCIFLWIAASASAHAQRVVAPRAAAGGAAAEGLSAGASGGSATSDGAACEAAADEAEQGFGLPRGLLRAIGIVESGRWQPALGRAAPWPYAIDAGGYSLFMETLGEAAAKVDSLRLQGLLSIDVGCFQINLMYHPDAFATVAEAFDPRANANYAARFLLGLKARSGNWETAVADYHSAVSAIGDPYRARVYSAWTGAPAAAPYTGGARVIRIGLGGISLGPMRSAIQVYTPRMAAQDAGSQRPAAARAAPVAAPVAASFAPAARPARRGLPMVFTPLSRL